MGPGNFNKTGQAVSPRSSPSEIETVLASCGVTASTLAPHERAALDTDGYVVLSNVMDPKWLARARAAIESAHAATGASAAASRTGTRHVDGLVEFGDAFDGVITNARVLAAVYHVLGQPFKLGQLGSRDPQPGFGQQGLHADWVARTPSEPYRVVTAIWMFDDFTTDNGATRVVPGSHKRLGQPPKAFASPGNHHPDEVVVTGAAGSVLVINGHLWHSGTRNSSSRSRRALQCVFVARDERRYATVEHRAADTLNAAVKYFLGI